MLLPTSSLAAFWHPGEMDVMFLHELRQWESWEYVFKSFWMVEIR